MMVYRQKNLKLAENVFPWIGFALESIKRVQFLLEKKRLKQDAETQTLEDVICLVFLEHYALEFAGTHPEEKVVDILQKTWGKMSAEGQAAALRLVLPEAVSRLVKKALGDG
jgi:hypothetical protein